MQMLIFVACQKKTDELKNNDLKDDTKVSDKTEQDNFADDTKKENNKIPEEYVSIIEKYVTALDEKWDEAKLVENGMSHLYANYYDGNVLENIGYALLDLNGDDKTELLIGLADNSGIMLDMYAIQNENVVCVFSAVERNRYTYCKDYRILNEGSISAAQSMTYMMKFNGQVLVVEEGVVYDASLSPETPWFKLADANAEKTEDTPINEAEAMKIVDEFKKQCEAIENIIPFSEYNK